MADLNREHTTEGIDDAAVTEWLSQHASVAPPLTFERIVGGQSNLTFRVRDSADSEWVLRRPPLGQVLATAHDMAREHRIITALNTTDVPVPATIGLADPTVNGSAFYVMEYVSGLVIRSGFEAEALSGAARERASEQLIEVLSRIHAVDVDAVGLGDLGRREGYIERQLKRWHGQWEKSKTRELPSVDHTFTRLCASIPTQGRATIVHGDYRLDNCLLSDSGDIAAVLDWELCTLGDPMADLGLLIVYWGEDDATFSALPGAPTRLEGFASATDLINAYGASTGRDVRDIDFFIAFGYWKLACILEGVYARYLGGSMGAAAEGWEVFAHHVELLASAAAAAIARFEDR